ncbi:DUF501 domain-containing protein [Congregibacter variabilis]|uniref:DUF501 domain-containing protein n=1 Tax=Congregibacter variabilis TaxID=3081200 RepID=A0ABZ0I3T8_9GAMM|nr:DUF501 domain-containing protein [Congregibacter sp. IMCC43200]
MTGSAQNVSLNEAMLHRVESRLGRRPRGLRQVMVLDDAGQPSVIRVASVVEEKPFPTLFWLIDPALNLRIDREEASGRIHAFQTRINDSPELQQAMEHDHQRHIELRESYLASGERELLESRGQWSALAHRGIGGIADFTRIRCLHTWYAAHLVEPNTVGQMLDEHWASCEEP